MGTIDLARIRQAAGKHPALLVGVIFILGLALRAPFLDSWTPDTFVCVVPWYRTIAAEGWRALGGSIPCDFGFTGGAYSPPYYYFLYLASLLDGLAPELWLAKLPTMAFELLAAFFAYKITRLIHSQTRAILAGAAVYLAPTVIANGAWWGQADAIWASLLLGTVYFALARRPLWAVAMFGVALAFKAQAIFISPFLFMLFLRGEVRFWHAFAVPLAVFAMLVPTVALGNSWEAATTVYLRQGAAFSELAKDSPNLWYFVPNTYYAVGVAVGVLLTAAASATLAALPRVAGSPAMAEGERSAAGIEARLLAATMFVALAPFLLPKMHDRYFFAADVFSIVLAVCAPRYWFVPVLFQLSSMGAYAHIIVASLTGAFKPAITQPLAAMLNTVTVPFLVLEFLRTCTRFGKIPGTLVKELVPALTAVVVATGGWGALALVWRTLGWAELPVNLGYAKWTDWLFFVPLLVLTFLAARIALARGLLPPRVWDWRRGQT